MVLKYHNNLFVRKFSLKGLMKSIGGAERAAVSKIRAIGEGYPDLIPET
jgi:hypothetical protein